MSTTLYKATRPDGTDFRTGRVQWTPPEGHEGEWVVHHPIAKTIGADASGYLSVSTDPTDLPGTQWPMRLHIVEAVGETGLDPSFPNKVTGLAFRYVREIPAHLRFGPVGEHVVALIERASRLIYSDVARDAARDAAWGAAGDAAGDAARGAAQDAAGALALRDLMGSHGFTQAHYDSLTGPWRKTIGKVHPDDAEVRS